MPQSAPVVVLEDFCVEKGGSGKVEKEETEEKEEKEAGHFAFFLKGGEFFFEGGEGSGLFRNSSCLRKAREAADSHTQKLRPITRQHPRLPSSISRI
jgi:hypothetical protein